MLEGRTRRGRVWAAMPLSSGTAAQRYWSRHITYLFIRVQKPFASMEKANSSLRENI